MTTEARTANVPSLIWGALATALTVALPEPPLRDGSWLDTAFLIVAATLMGTGGIQLKYGSFNMSGAATSAAVATVSPLQAALVGLAGMARRAWSRRQVDRVPPNLGSALWGAAGASIRIACTSVGMSVPAAIGVALLAGVIINVISASVALSFRTRMPASHIVRQALTPAVLGAYGYFLIAAALAATMLGHSLEGLVKAAGLFALAIAISDSVGGRSIRAFLERQLVAVEPHVQYGQLARGTFHDLRNHITSAIANLREAEVSPSAADRALAMSAALTSLDEARTVLQDAEASGRVASLAGFTTVDLTELCRHIGRLHKRTATDHDLDIRVDGPEAEVLVFGHPVLLGEVLTNLILNAIDASEPGGAVAMTCESGDGVHRVLVRDTGHGVPLSSRDRLFEPGFTSKGSHGTGLGLYNALGIARQHHGNLEYSAMVGGPGACFVLTLPDLRNASHAPLINRVGPAPTVTPPAL